MRTHIAKPESARSEPTPTGGLFRANARAARWAPQGTRPTLRPRTTALQTKLRVSTPGDPFEREADRVADYVMRDQPTGTASISTIPGRVVHRECAGCKDKKEHDKEDRRVQRQRASTPGPLTPSAEAAVRGVGHGGAPLPRRERSFFENRFGRSFADVRIHTGARADVASRAIGARAFTTGQHIAFASGEYRPGTAEGRRLMAHELTHTVQQTGDTVHRLPCRYGSGEATQTVNVQPVVIANDDGSAPTSACNFATVKAIWDKCCVTINVKATKTEKKTSYKTLDFTPNVATAEPSALIASYANATTIPVIFHDLLKPSGSAASKNGGTGGAFTRGGRIVFTVDGVAPEVVAHEVGHALGSGHGLGTRADGVDTVMKPTSAYNSANTHNVSQAICDNARTSAFSTGGASADCCQLLD